MSDDALSPECISQGLKTQLIGKGIFYYPSLASTMDAGRQAALEGASEGTVILAGAQTSGRGRLKRRWLSTAGCLTFSVILYPDTGVLPFLVMISAIAVAETLESLAPLSTDIKWPNDVLIRGKKVSGILIETGIREGRPNFAVVGIGLNVNIDMSGCPEICETATSLAAETGNELSRVAVLRELLCRLDRWYQALLKGEPVLAAWRCRLSTLGKAVRVKMGQAVYEGVAEDVAPDGALLLRTADGKLLRMPAGDVTLNPRSF